MKTSNENIIDESITDERIADESITDESISDGNIVYESIRDGRRTQMLVEIRNLQVFYGRFQALDIDRTLEIREGERIGIIGSNGAGKTTLVKTILGLTSYKGRIETRLKPQEMAAHLQFNQYVSTMTVRHVLETLLDTSIRTNQRLRDLIEYFEFEECLKKRYKSLSGGQKQRLTIIMVMMQDAPLTFYDEVTSGLDFETRQRLMEKLLQWYKGKNNTLCIVSHYYEELELLANRLLILDQGKVIDYGEKEALFHKYCGESIMTLDANEENERLTASYQKLAAPSHLIALACREKAEEEELAKLLIHHNVNFKRSNSDIEIMSINAKAAYAKEHGNGGVSND